MAAPTTSARWTRRKNSTPLPCSPPDSTAFFHRATARTSMACSTPSSGRSLVKKNYCDAGMDFQFRLSKQIRGRNRFMAGNSFRRSNEI
jgi:hypothetical protein